MPSPLHIRFLLTLWEGWTGKSVRHDRELNIMPFGPTKLSLKAFYHMNAMNGRARLCFPSRFRRVL